jgi:hypothetical protein
MAQRDGQAVSGVPCFGAGLVDPEHRECIQHDWHRLVHALLDIGREGSPLGVEMQIHDPSLGGPGDILELHHARSLSVLSFARERPFAVLNGDQHEDAQGYPDERQQPNAKRVPRCPSVAASHTDDNGNNPY